MKDKEDALPACRRTAFLAVTVALGAFLSLAVLEGGARAFLAWRARNAQRPAERLDLLPAEPTWYWLLPPETQPQPHRAGGWARGANPHQQPRHALARGLT